MSISKVREYKMVRILFSALFISAILVSPLSGSFQTAAASSDSGTEPVEVTPGLRAAIQETLGPKAFAPVNEDAKLNASDGAAYDMFGYAVAISGDTALVAAVGDNDTGSAYIFERDQGGTDNWGEVKKLTVYGGGLYANFGFSVSLDGDTALVGARWADNIEDRSGSAYVFERDQGGAGNWGLVKKLTAYDGVQGGSFGRSVALSGDTVLVGAQEDDNRANSDTAYLFERDQGGAGNWGLVKKLTALDGTGNDGFGGRSVALSGDTALVGAYYDDDNGRSSGSVYVFERNQGGLGNWGEVKKITASDGAAGDHFGIAVALSGDTALVGATGGDGNDTNTGSAYIFERDQGGAGNWGEVKKLTASDGERSDDFSRSVALSGDIALVGAYRDDDACPTYSMCESGSAYLFERDQGGAGNWGEAAKLIPSDNAEFDWFGWSVALSGDTALVGASRDDARSWNSGSVYVFEASASVGDVVWDDLDADGVQDGGEPGLGGVGVILYDANLASPDEAGFPQSYAVVATTVTAGDGSYTFDDLSPGSYFLYFTLPSGYFFSPQDEGGDDALDSDADPYGHTDVFSLIDKQNDTTRDAGMYRLPSIGDLVWEDDNKDGLQDMGEPGMSGVTVELYENGVGLVDATLTSGDGSYNFTGLDPGDYYLVFYTPDGYLFSPRDQGGDDSLDSDADPSTGQTANVALTYGDADSDWDAGMHLVDYLTNGSFENPLGAEWEQIVSGNGDRRVADAQAQDGGYIYLFQADGGLEFIKQTVTQSGVAGDEYTLTFYFGGKGVDLSGKLGARLILKNGSVLVDKKTCVFTPPASTFSWTAFTCTITATGDFDSIQIRIGMQNVSGGMVGVDMAILNKTGP